MSIIPFPSTSPDGKTPLSPVWMNFLQAIWNRTGGAAGGAFAGTTGNSAVQFNVETATNPSNAVPLAQLQAGYAAIGGNQAQAFFVGNSTAGTNTAVRRTQADALYVGYTSTPAAIEPITATGSPFAYTATAGGVVVVTGGTVTGIALTRGSAVAMGQTTGNFPVRNGDILTVTYSASPTMTFIPS
jgi:hypothetical protein